MEKIDQKEIVLGTHGENYGSWMSMPALYLVGGLTAAACVLGIVAKKLLKLALLGNILLAGSVILLLMLLWMIWTRKQYGFGQGGVMDRIHQYLVDQIDWNGKGELLEVGCGSGPMSIRCAKTFPEAKITGVDYWGAMWDTCYNKENCDNNARLEGVGDRCTFVKGDATHLDFPDESFDVVISNLVYHNIPAAKKQDLLLETLRVLKKGGVFVLQDSIKSSYGNMDEFMQKLRDMGYESVRLADADREIFGSAFKAQLYFVGNLKALIGKK